MLVYFKNSRKYEKENIITEKVILNFENLKVIILLQKFFYFLCNINGS